MAKYIFLMALICINTALADIELVINGDFDGNITGWNTSANSSGYDSSNDVAYLGWGDLNSIYQNTGSVFLPDTIYTFKAVVSSVENVPGGHQYEGVQLVLIKIVDGVWTDAIAEDFWFPPEDENAGNPGNFREFVINFDTADNPSVAGKKIGVGVKARDTSVWGSNGWLYVNSISVLYRTANPTSPADDTDVNDNLNEVGTIGDNGIDVQLEWTTMRDPGDPNSVLINPDVTAHYVRVVENEPNFIDPAAQIYTVDNGMVGETGLLFLEDLNPASVYYWRVDESINNSSVDDPGTVIGPVQAFETIPVKVVFTDGPDDILVADGGSAQFAVDTFSVNPVTYAWYHSDDLVQDPFTDTSFGDDANTAVLSDILLSEGDEHTYVYCVANNGTGDVFSSPALVEIERKVSEWKMDSSLDDSENGWTGIYTMPAELTFGPDMDGIADRALYLADDANHVQITGSEDHFNFYHLGLTASCWIKSDGHNWAGYVCKQDREGYDPWNGYVFETNGSGFASFNIRGVGGVAGKTVVNDNFWHLVTATYDGASGEMALYVDGEQEAVAVFEGIIPRDSDSPVTIGAEQTSGEAPYAGLIDQVEIYNYALSAADVLDIYNKSSKPDKILCILDYAEEIDVANAATGLTVDDEGFEPDCKIQIFDFAVFASYWLECGLYPGCP